MITFLKNILTGLLIGSGAILPGISSGVILVSLGLYEKLLNSVLSFLSNVKDNLKLIVPIILGCILGVILFGNILNTYYIRYPNISKFCFIGLILGTIPSVIKTANSHSKYIKFKNIMLSFISFLITMFMILVEKNTTNNLTTISQYSYFYLILSGFLMSIGIVIPRNK